MYPSSRPLPPSMQMATKPRLSLAKIIGIIAGLVGFLSALTGILQFLGVTHLPVVSNFIHPGADQILSKAKAADYKDLTCTMAFTLTGTGGGAVATLDTTGSCAFTSNPQRAQYQLHVTETGTTPYDQTDIIDVPSDARYRMKTGDTKWTKDSASSSCQVGQACALGLIDSPVTFYNLSETQFIGAESVNNQDTYHVRGNTPSTSMAPPGVTISSSTADLWFAQDTYYPVRLMLTVAGSSPSTSSTPAISYSYTFSLDFSGYNLGTTIPLPSPDQVAP